jgi:flagellar biosynthesis chaperone FliJ
MSSKRQQNNLEQLLNIRQRRYEKALTEAKKAYEEWQENQQQLEEAKRILHEHRNNRAVQHKNLFNNLTQQAFTPQKYAEYTAEVLRMEQYERELEEAIHAFKKTVIESENTYNERKQTALSISHEVDKLSKALDKTKKKNQQIQAKKDENEADEFSQTIHLHRT